MLDINDARRIVLSQVRVLPSVRLSLADALNHSLATAVTCDLDDPPFDKTLMDGYAVRAGDVVTVPVRLRIVGQIGAGHVARAAVEPGTAMQINTGAPLPVGADAVVRVEDTQVEGDQVVVRANMKPGSFVVPQGQYARSGKEILARGTRLTPVNLGAAATAGAAVVEVHRTPSVSILVTGDELVDVDRRPTQAQIRNSNRYLLQALFRSEQIKARILGVAGDDREGLRRLIQRGFDSDVLCITGGVSAGAFDFVPGVLTELGATTHFHKISIKPGRPALFAVAPTGALIFALPGNPVSALTGFELLVRPALAAMQGLAADIPRYFTARAMGGFPATGARRTFHPGVASVNDDGQWQVTKLSWDGSGDSMGTAGANAMIMRPPQSPEVGDGETVSMFLLG